MLGLLAFHMTAIAFARKKAKKDRNWRFSIFFCKKEAFAIVGGSAGEVKRKSPPLTLILICLRQVPAVVGGAESDRADEEEADEHCDFG